MYLIVNYKTYPNASGEKSVELTKSIFAATVKRPDVTLVICPQAADIYRIREQFPQIQIWAQHIDAISPGRNNGWTSPETVVMAGANGTLISHSERRLDIETTIATRARSLEVGLAACACVDTAENAKPVITMTNPPEFIAFEPPELISTGQSILSLDPQTAETFLPALSNFTGYKILGAGVSTREDLNMATKLGFDGVLISSAITTSDTPEAKVSELLEGFPQT